MKKKPISVELNPPELIPDGEYDAIAMNGNYQPHRTSWQIMHGPQGGRGVIQYHSSDSGYLPNGTARLRIGREIIQRIYQGEILSTRICNVVLGIVQ